MTERDEPEPAPASGRGWLAWLGWGFVALGAAGGLWLASLPLDRMLPEPHPQRALAPEPPSADLEASEPPEAAGGAGEPETAPAPAPEAEAIDVPALTPSAEWTEESPGEDEEAPAAADTVRDRLERQLLMNDLGSVRVEIVGDRIVTSGRLARASDRQRVALLVRSLAPEYLHEDRAQDPGGP